MAKADEWTVRITETNRWVGRRGRRSRNSTGFQGDVYRGKDLQLMVFGESEAEVEREARTVKERVLVSERRKAAERVVVL